MKPILPGWPTSSLGPTLGTQSRGPRHPLNRFDEAVTHAEEARQRAQLPLDVLMSVNCLGWIHYRAGPWDEAADHYLRAADLADLAESDYERACTGLGNIAARRGDHRTAGAGGPTQTSTRWT